MSGPISKLANDMVYKPHGYDSINVVDTIFSANNMHSNLFQCTLRFLYKSASSKNDSMPDTTDGV